MEYPLVSVIVPVYNGERWIGRTLASAAAQTYDNIEIIVVDDESIDQTAIIADAAASQDPRISVFRRPHSGVSATRNFGISRARGSLIATLDADDLWHPEKLARQVAVMQKSSPKVGLVYCWTVEIDEDDFIIPPVRKGSSAQGNVLIELITKGGIVESGSNPLIRRSCLDAVGGYDPSQHTAEDWKLCLTLAEFCEFALVPAHLVGYRRSRESKSRNENMEKALALLSASIIEKWPDMPPAIRSEMIYNQKTYLAHLALTNGQVGRATRHQFRAYRARPRELFTHASLVFAARILARRTGIRRGAGSTAQRRLSFKEFQARQRLREAALQATTPSTSAAW
jgi:glycosyltransferase involved in cell wall biosynthesis